MTETGFRDLFVELPTALFDALQGIAEEAVRKATPQPSVTPPARPRVPWNAVAGRYGWRKAESRRLEWTRATVVAAELECGHGYHWQLDDYAIASARDLIEALDAAVDRAPRRCYCTPKPA